MSEEERRTPAEEPGTDATSDTATDAGAAWRRRRRLDAVFGDVLPETTSDERDVERPGGSSGDDWLRSQVPPHHG